jgi:hypothetical protein
MEDAPKWTAGIAIARSGLFVTFWEWKLSKNVERS